MPIILLYLKHNFFPLFKYPQAKSYSLLCLRKASLSLLIHKDDRPPLLKDRIDQINNAIMLKPESRPNNIAKKEELIDFCPPLFF